MKKLKYQPGTGKLTYANGKPYKKKDALEVAFELGHGFKSNRPLTLINESRGLALDNILPVEAPVSIPDGITVGDRGEYTVEWDSIVYGTYRSLEVATKVLELAIRGHKKRTAKERVNGDIVVKSSDLKNALKFVSEVTDDSKEHPL
jgi:hypothetical protein